MRVTCFYGLLILLLSSAGPAIAAADERLVEAVRSGDYATARALVEAGGDVDTPEADGTTALHWAVRQDQAGITNLLLHAEADANTANRYGMTPLLLAGTNGSPDIVASLLDGRRGPEPRHAGGRDAADDRGAHREPGRCCACLLTHGARVDDREAWRKQTALMWAAAEGNAAAARVLLDAGADVAARSSRGMTALLFAARSGDLDTVRALLTGGANIDETAMDAVPERRRATHADEYLPPRLGSSVLATAIENAYYDLAAWLVVEGADLNADGPRGTALHGLVRTRNCERTALPCPVRSGPLDSLELAKMLLAHGADVNARMTANPPRNGTYDYTYMSHVGATPLFPRGQGLRHGDDAPPARPRRRAVDRERRAHDAAARRGRHRLHRRTDPGVRREGVRHRADAGRARRGRQHHQRQERDGAARRRLPGRELHRAVPDRPRCAAGYRGRAGTYAGHDCGRCRRRPLLPRPRRDRAALLRERMGSSAPPRPTTQGAR